MPNPVSSAGKWKAAEFDITVLAAIAALVSAEIMSTGSPNNCVLGIVFIAAVVYFVVMLSAKKMTANERMKGKGFISLVFTSAMVWTMNRLFSTTFAVHSDTRVDLNIGCRSAPTSARTLPAATTTTCPCCVKPMSTSNATASTCRRSQKHTSSGLTLSRSLTRSSNSTSPRWT